MRILFIFPFILCLHLAAQNNSREKAFFFNIGSEFRITPIYKPYDQSVSTYFTNIDFQNSGPVVNVGAEYYFSNKFSFGFNNSFRYDLITTHKDGRASGGQVAPSIDRGLMFGYHAAFNYRFQIFKKGDLLITAGWSLLNRNSEYMRTESTYNQEGDIIETTSSIDNFNFSASKFSIGYGNGKSKLMMGIYISGNTRYFSEKTTFIVPMLSYGFDVGKL